MNRNLLSKAIRLVNTLMNQRIWNMARILDLKTCSITRAQRLEVARKPEFIPHYRNAPHSVVSLGHKVQIHNLYFLQRFQIQLQILGDLIHPVYAQWQLTTLSRKWYDFRPLHDHRYSVLSLVRSSWWIVFYCWLN